EAAEQHLHLDRREVLHLVDRDVPVAERRTAASRQRPDAELPGAEKERVVLGVELRLRRAVAVRPGEDALALIAVGGGGALDLVTGERARRDLREHAREKLGVAERAAPVVQRLQRGGRS